MEQVYLEKKDIIHRYLWTHHLYPRLPASEVLTVTRTLGFKELSPTSYDIALAARLEPLTHDVVNHQWSSNKVIRTLGVGRETYIIPLNMWRVFNRPLAPLDESELQHLIPEIEPLIVALDTPLYQLYEVLIESARNVLSEKPMPQHDFYLALSKAIIEKLAPSKREVWLWPSTVGKEKTIGDSVIEALLPVISCSVPIALEIVPGKPEYHYSLVHTSELPDTSELMRRFIHAHGPTDYEELALWAHISPAHAKRLWLEFPQGALREVRWDDGLGYMLKEDRESLKALPRIEGLRFIGSCDPLLDVKQRSLWVSGKTLFNYFFRSDDRPGMVLHDGEVVAGWYFRGKKKSFSLLIEDIGQPFGRIAKDELMAEISHMGDALGMKNEGFSYITR